MSRVGASTTSIGNKFQSLMVLGRKVELLYWVLVVSTVSCLSWVRRWHDGRGISLAFRVGQCANVQGHSEFCRALKVYKSGVVVPRVGQPNASGMLLTLEVFLNRSRTKRTAHTCTHTCPLTLCCVSFFNLCLLFCFENQSNKITASTSDQPLIFFIEFFVSQ